jgi:hypothetical protein
MLKRRDFWWLLGYPIYQVIGTIRHESAHALVAVLNGGEVIRFSFLPSVVKGKFYWGYVITSGPKGWLTLFAPYLLDLITFIFFFILCMAVLFKRRWIWLNLVIIGLVSPLANSLYNYLGGLRSMNDVGRLFTLTSRLVIDLYFIGTLLIYFSGLAIVFLFSRTALNERNQVNQAS